MPERPKGHDWKSCAHPKGVPRVRIPLPPQKGNMMWRTIVTLWTGVVVMVAQAQETQQATQTGASFHQTIKEKFIEGDPLWMSPILLCFIFGLAVAIERILTISFVTGNPRKILATVEEHLKNGNVNALKEEVSKKNDTYSELVNAALSHLDEGIDMVEKALNAKGSLMASKLERGLPWINLFISISPMLGFLGTVVGMVIAFEDIAAANTISPAIVAHGISVALLTTLAGLIVAIILQLFYNFILARIDGVVGDLEDFSISLVDMIVRYSKK